MKHNFSYCLSDSLHPFCQFCSFYWDYHQNELSFALNIAVCSNQMITCFAGLLFHASVITFTKHVSAEFPCSCQLNNLRCSSFMNPGLINEESFCYLFFAYLCTCFSSAWNLTWKDSLLALRFQEGLWLFTLLCLWIWRLNAFSCLKFVLDGINFDSVSYVNACIVFPILQDPLHYILCNSVFFHEICFFHKIWGVFLF